MDPKEFIPQREPFLFIDEISDLSESSIVCRKSFPESLDFFKGHFPNNPIVPGVILNEACFQSAAALIGANQKDNTKTQLAVVSRIQNAKFKNMVKPNDTITIETKLEELLLPAAIFKSSIKNQDNLKIATIGFTCTLVENKD